MRILGSLVWLLALVCMIWVIYDVAAKHKHWKTGKKVLWIILAVFFSIITAIVYYFVAYKKK